MLLLQYILDIDNSVNKANKIMFLVLQCLSISFITSPIWEFINSEE